MALINATIPSNHLMLIFLDDFQLSAASVSRDSDRPLLRQALRFRSQTTSFPNDLRENGLEHGEKDCAADWECARGEACHATSLNDTPATSDLTKLMVVWRHLSPHIREAIWTLVDADLASSQP